MKGMVRPPPTSSPRKKYLVLGSPPPFFLGGERPASGFQSEQPSPFSFFAFSLSSLSPLVVLGESENKIVSPLSAFTAQTCVILVPGEQSIKTGGQLHAGLSHTCMHTCGCVWTHVHKHTYAHTHVHAHIYAHTQECMHADACEHMHTHVHVFRDI